MGITRGFPPLVAMRRFTARRCPSSALARPLNGT